jgi:hypothetical protein
MIKHLIYLIIQLHEKGSTKEAKLYYSALTLSKVGTAAISILQLCK